MGRLSRESGADGERTVAHLFRDYGYNAERGVQHDGRTGHADVEGVPFLHIEVKFYQKIAKGDIRRAMEQSERDAGAWFEETGKSLLPVVIHKVKRAHGWNVSMRVSAITELMIVPPFEADADLDGIVQMEFEDFIKLYMVYENWRREQ